MSTTTDHLIGGPVRVSLSGSGESTEGADVQSMPVSQNGLSSELLEELAALAAEKVRGEGLRLMGEGGLLPELAQHLPRLNRRIRNAPLETRILEMRTPEMRNGRSG